MWEVLAELSALLGDETGIDSAPEALAAIASEVPFYAGITPEEIGGRGVRWQERDAASRFPVGEQRGGVGAATGSELLPDRVALATGLADDDPSLPHPTANGGLRLGTYRDLWAAEVTERSPSLRFLFPQQTLELAPTDAERLGIGDREEVEVRSNGTSLRARARIRERISPGSVFLIDGLGDAAGTLRGEVVEIAQTGGSE